MSKDFVKGLGLVSATTLVMGSMIGSGIFIVPADMARVLSSPFLLIVAWLITAFLTIVGALMFAEFAAMMPKAGGQYIFLRESFGPLWGFLYGWTLFLIIQTGTIAAVAVGFGKFLGVFFPSIAADAWIFHMGRVPALTIGSITLGNMDIGLNTQNLVAILVILFLSFVNVYGVKAGALVQNVFTFTKVAALLGLILIGIGFGMGGEVASLNFSNFFTFPSEFPTGDAIGSTMGVLMALAVVQVGSLFSADAWNGVTFAAAEVKNPQRNLPLALGIGTGSVVLLYILANFAYLMILPLQAIQNAPADRVATAMLEQVFVGWGAKLMAVVILISTFGCINGIVLSGARVYYAMSEDGLFFKSVGKLHNEYRTPHMALWAQGLWAAFLCLTGSYGQLLDFTIFAALLFYILTIAGLFVLRKKKPKAERPYKAVGYPWLPASYIVVAAFIEFALLRYKPQYTWPGLFLVLLGVPVYFYWATQGKRSRR